jgi:hypothetical protein
MVGWGMLFGEVVRVVVVTSVPVDAKLFVRDLVV